MPQVWGQAATLVQLGCYALDLKGRQGAQIRVVATDERFRAFCRVGSLYEVRAFGHIGFGQSSVNSGAST